MSKEDTVTLFTASTIFFTLLSIFIALHYRAKAIGWKVEAEHLEYYLKESQHGEKWYQERYHIVQKELEKSRQEALEAKKELEKLIGRE